MALAGGVSGPVIRPGDSANSRLIHRVRGMGNERQMPLGRPALSEQQIVALERWIAEGAVWPASPFLTTRVAPTRHWAYVPVTRPAVPAVR